MCQELIALSLTEMLLAWLQKLGRKLYHIISIAYHDYASDISTCKDYKSLESVVWYGSFQIHIFLLDSHCEGQLGVRLSIVRVG